MNSENQPEPSWFSKLRAGEPLQIMQVGTIIWLIFLVLFVLMTDQCAFKWDVAWYRPDLRYFSCRTSNELGDFLAGAFAPLAFLWLAGAVFIQSRELKDQKEVLSLTRQELELTREEMGEQRKVMEAQAKEAKASAKFLGKQTEILSRQQALADQQAADDEFEEILNSVLANAVGCDHISIARPDLPDEILVSVIFFGNSSAVLDVFSRLADCGQKIDAFYKSSEFDEQKEHYIRSRDFGLLVRLYSSLQKVNEIVTHLSPEGRQKYVRLQCQEAYENFDHMIEQFASDNQKKEIQNELADLEEKLEILSGSVN